MKAGPMPGYAFARLLWRPMGLIIVPVVVWTFLLPTADLPNGPTDLFEAIRTESSDQQVRFALWRIAVFVPLACGFICGIFVHEVMQTGISWMIPGYRAKLIVPATLTVAPILLIVGVATARAVSWDVAAGAFGLGVVSFCVGWRMTARTVVYQWHLIGVLALGGIALRPGILDSLLGWHPVLLGLVAASVGVPVFASDISARTGRELIVVAPGLQGLVPDPKRFLSRVSSSTKTLTGRVHAGIYESGGISAHFGILAYQIAWFGLLGVLSHNTAMVVITPMLFSILMGTQLRDSFVYPMTRRERADAFFASSLFDSLTAAIIASIAALILTALGLWRGGSNESGPGQALIALVFLVLFSPIGHAVQASRNMTPTRKNKISAVRMLGAMAVVMFWFGTALAASKIFGDSIESAPLFTTTVGFVAGFLAIQTIYLFGLRWYFARRDFPN